MFLEVNRIKRISSPRHLYYCTRSTKYCQAKRLCQTKHIILLHFLANKPRHKLSGVTKKIKTFCTQGTIHENAELRPARQSIAGNHHIHSKYFFLVGKIQTKLLPRAMLIQLSNVRLYYFKVYPEIALPHFQK